MTAVEWLYDKLKLSLPEHMEDLLAQALQMEKEQIENEFERGFLKCADTLQFILDKGLLNNYNKEINDNRSY